MMSRIGPTNPPTNPPTNQPQKPAKSQTPPKQETNASFRISLPVLTELFALADSKGNGNWRVDRKEWEALLSSPANVNADVESYKRKDDDTIVSDNRFPNDNSGKTTRIINNFKKADGFNQIQKALLTLSENRAMRESLFAYGLQIQEERKAPHHLIGQEGFDTHNVPDGIALSAFSRFGDKVDGVLYNPEQGRWGGSAGSK